MGTEPLDSLTRDSIAKMVENASTQNLSVWAMVVILFIFLCAMVVIIKVFMSSSVKTNEGLRMVIEQSTEQLNIFRISIDKISENFRILSENLTRMQVLKINEDDKFETLAINFNNLKQEILDNNTNVLKTVMDHDRSTCEFYLSNEKSLDKFRSNMLEMKAFCGVASDKRKRLGDILVEDGVCNREQINHAVKKQTLMQLKEDKKS